MLLNFCLSLIKFIWLKWTFFQKNYTPSWFMAVACCLVLSSIFWSNWINLPIYAANSSSIDTLKQRQQVIQQQQQRVIKERDRLNNLQQEAQKNLTGLNQNIQVTDNQIQDNTTRLEYAIAVLQQLESDLVVAQEAYQQRQTATVARLRALQRSPMSQGWAVLLQSQNLSDFMSRRQQLKLVYQADQQILAQLTAQGKLLNQQRTVVEAQKNQVALIREQLLAQKADFQAQAQLQTQLVQRLNSDRLALEAAQNQLEQDSQNIAALIQRKVAQEQAKTASKSIIIRGTGILAFPSNAPLSSPFGWRTHPILGYRRFHGGLDFAASYGSPIRAADSGTVIFAGWYGGYGKAVIINHGSEMTTLYGHASELYVTEGQTVQRGQAIAAVGSTGLSTGPHLHFEVRRDGTPVNPANYL